MTGQRHGGKVYRSFEEFQKEFYPGIGEKEKPTAVGSYELGVKMATESLGKSKEVPGEKPPRLDEGSDITLLRLALSEMMGN